MRIALFTETYLPYINGVVTHVKLLREGLEKLIRMGRTDLIDKYKRTFQELGIFGMTDSFTEQATAELDRYSEACLQELLSMDTGNCPEGVSELPADEEDDWDD